MAITRKKLLECNESQSSVKNPAQHSRSGNARSEGGRFTCKQCHKGFLEHTNLVRHRRVHAASSLRCTQQEEASIQDAEKNECVCMKQCKEERPDGATSCESTNDVESRSNRTCSFSQAVEDTTKVKAKALETVVKPEPDHAAEQILRTGNIVDFNDKRNKLAASRSSRTVMQDRKKASSSPPQQIMGQQNVFHRTLRSNWSKLVTDKITVMAFVRALKGHQCASAVGTRCQS